MKVRSQNGRRFFRYDTIAPFHVIAVGDKNHLQSFDIYSAGINYINENTNVELDNYRNNAVNMLHKVVDSPDMKKAFLYTISRVDFLRAQLEKVQAGINPMANANYNDLISKYEISLNNYSLFENSARTKEMLQYFDSWIAHLFNDFEQIINNSTPSQLYSINIYKEVELSKKILGLKLVFKENKAPLAGMFIYIYQYVYLIYQIMVDMLGVHWVRQYPEKWKSSELNLSCGGLGFRTSYEYPRGSRLELLLRINVPERINPNGYEIIETSARVVSTKKGFNENIVSCEFLFCNNETMKLIDSHLLSLELSDAIKVSKGLVKNKEL